MSFFTTSAAILKKPVTDLEIEHQVKMSSIVVAMGANPIAPRMALDIQALRHLLKSVFQATEYLERLAGKSVPPEMKESLKVVRECWKDYLKQVETKKPRAKKPAEKVTKKRRK